MIYLTPPTTSVIERIVDNPQFGAIITPDSDRPALYNLAQFQHWGADNGCFSATFRFDDTRYMYWLLSLRSFASTCLFATAPDVVGNHEKTWERSKPWLGAIRVLGFPAAFVAQDGFNGGQGVDWEMIDVLFVGGTTSYKLGDEARKAIRKAQELGKKVHVGRVNSKRRVEIFNSLKVDSIDGTFLIFGPNTNFPKLERWVKSANNYRQEVFF